MSFVHVKDVAEAHRKAAEIEEANGRYICAPHVNMTLADLFKKKIKQIFPETKAPQTALPNVLLPLAVFQDWIGSKISKRDRRLTRDMVRGFFRGDASYDSSKAQNELEMDWIDFDTCVKDTVEAFSLNKSVIISRLLWIILVVTIILSMMFHSQSEHFRDWPFFVSESDHSGLSSLIFTAGFMLSGISLAVASWMMWAHEETITQNSIENISRISGILSGICLCGLAVFDMYAFTLVHVIFASTCSVQGVFGCLQHTKRPRRGMKKQTLKDYASFGLGSWLDIDDSFNDCSNTLPSTMAGKSLDLLMFSHMLQSQRLVNIFGQLLLLAH